MRALDDCIKEDKSKADKMLEKLGYRKNYEVRNGADYDNSEISVIHFDKADKLVRFYNEPKIDIKGLQAINEKCKELGWLDKEKNE